MNLNLFLKRVDRIVVWFLLTLFLVEMFSGYMITRGFINWYYGMILHTILDVPLMTAFSFHVAVNLRLTMIRWGFKPRFANVISTIAGTGPLIFAIYLDTLPILLI